MVKYNVAAASIAILLATSGCDKQATGQTVAVVDGEEISAAELNAELAQANVPESVDKKTVMPQLLQRVVDRKLLAQQAIEQGIDKTPEYLTRQRRMNEELLIGLYMKRQSDAAKLPDAQAINAFIAANPQMFAERAVLSLNQIAFDMPRDPSVLQPMTDDHSLDEVAATLIRLGIPFQRGTGRLDTAQAPKAVMDQINALPAGEPFVLPQAGKAIASVVTAREPAPITGEQARRLAAEAVRRQQMSATFEKQLEQLRAAAKIEYQPGYAPKAAPKAPAAGKADGKS